MAAPGILRRQRIDVPLLITALLLTVFGLAMVFSAGQTDMPDKGLETLWQRQLAFFGVAVAATWVITRGSVRLIEWSAWPLYVMACVLLLLLQFLGSGAGTAASTKQWLTIGGVRLGQPAELAKLATTFMLARVLASQRDTVTSMRELWKPLLVVAVPWVLVLASKDLGTALTFIGICFAMLFWAGVPWPVLLMLASPGISLILAFSTGVWGAWFLILVALVLWYRPYLLEGVVLVVANVVMGVVAPLLWDKLKPYQQQRFLVFLDPSVDAQGSGYNVIQSQVAIGSGGLFGKGFTLGSQKRLNFLPEQQTDFIFSVVGEELGFVGVVVALALFLALFLRSTRIAVRAADAFPSLVAFGLMSAWFVHVLVNVGMTLNLMPVTGIPLPFFSYGGSFLLVSWLAVAVLLRISAEGRGQADALGL
ncbi:rod shape-determining protein RodA [Gemmatimonas sp.]|jgi:rod shape determining protein RodA|uniref:rod shape-determining protein RodA n=2 Tax=Gemmatimonas sp. TaxID=1962908 RepID=UPI0022C6E5C2|nr:rod shape-determining protein RodA [Gemmatimonas sp.]MCA2982408.1 rod shape-determining protein RodA [Gemmatimonas sp.]MCA2988198.1 rod shape-determining protein RodA [Gemmatimonas sp.]MCA2990410.1 rod shape-determining protein RodA [Gemmatimonas sp.]MCA2994123.1 rod shape-determining protein RodA [Gemmatimonas sp.]MCE2954169.1 rod shape-determining protein RodA [Gemmatimonas sp.]